MPGLRTPGPVLPQERREDLRREYGSVENHAAGSDESLRLTRGRVLQALPDAGRLPEGERQRDRGSDVRRDHGLDQGGAVPPCGAQPVAPVSWRVLPRGGAADRARAQPPGVPAQKNEPTAL